MHIPESAWENGCQALALPAAHCLLGCVHGPNAAVENTALATDRCFADIAAVIARIVTARLRRLDGYGFPQ